jgi:hypothetical protein
MECDIARRPACVSTPGTRQPCCVLLFHLVVTVADKPVFWDGSYNNGDVDDKLVQCQVPDTAAVDYWYFVRFVQMRLTGCARCRNLKDNHVKLLLNNVAQTVNFTLFSRIGLWQGNQHCSFVIPGPCSQWAVVGFALTTCIPRSHSVQLHAMRRNEPSLPGLAGDLRLALVSPSRALPFLRFCRLSTPARTPTASAAALASASLASPSTRSCQSSRAPRSPCSCSSATSSPTALRSASSLPRRYDDLFSRTAALVAQSCPLCRRLVSSWTSRSSNA